MTNDPHHKRSSKAELITWLLDHPEIWEGYPKPASEIVGRSHSLLIFSHMKSAGLFAERSQCNPLTIADLITRARAAKRLKETGVEGIDL